ncbi:NAD(P)-binding domain-containing protein [Streptosporangium sp. NPDC050855]|uniref:NAD(P)-binding domain-containing protein n=1 Tax=Streptosporangium sp. NPDC050855 TaxID=3366194 RepID=UPI0037A8B2D1
MISFLGLGRMGVPMARRLVAAGYEVTTWNRTPRTVEGAASAASPAEAVAGAEVVVTMLSHPAAVRRVLSDAAPGLGAGTVVAEMSTIGPEAVAGLRDLLPSGVGLVDAPVLGSVGPAADGTLTVLAGGLPGDLARCRKVLGAFGRVLELGGPGSGAAMKVTVMGALVPAQVLLAETVAYARGTGVDTATLLDVLAATPLGPLVERVRPAVEHGPSETRYALGLAAKDVALVSHGTGTIADAAGARLAEAVAAGLGGADLTAIFAHLSPSGPTGADPDGAGRAGVRRLNPASVPATNGYYSHATRTGNLLFVSGQVAVDEDGNVVAEGDMSRQSAYVMDLVARILADQGCTFDDVTHIRTFLTDMSRLPEYAAERVRHITGEPPASTTVEVSRLFRPGLVIEVEVVAAVPAGR